MLATCSNEFFMKALLFSLLIGIITCFLEGPLVVIWILNLGLGLPLTMLFTWSILFALRAGKASLILSTFNILADILVACVYDLTGLLFPTWFMFSAKGFLFWKYLEITLTSFFDLTGRWGGRGTLSIVTGTGLGCSLLFLVAVRTVLVENLDVIFSLNDLDLLSV